MPRVAYLMSRNVISVRACRSRRCPALGLAVSGAGLGRQELACAGRARGAGSGRTGGQYLVMIVVTGNPNRRSA